MNVAVYNWPRYRPRKRPEATATNGSPEPRKDLNVVYIDRDEPTLGFPFYPDTIPEELIPGNVWVCCDPDKVPMVATERNRRAKSSAPSTWRSYEAAREAYEAEWHTGVGRVIVKGEGLVGVDLDDCRAGATGTITPRARGILERLDSYSEVSPSGAGVKVWVRATLERSYVKPGVEIYAGGRYFTTTGQILPQYAASPQERTEELREIIAQEFPRQKKRRGRGAVGGQVKGRRLDLGTLLHLAGLQPLHEVGDDEAEIKYLILCPWIHEHTTNPESGAYVGMYPNGVPFFWCWHGHCKHRKWHHFYRAALRSPRPIDFMEVNISFE